MLTEIIDTPGRNKLASFYLQSHTRAFHPEEIRRNISEPGSVVASNLKHFVRKGFLLPVERKGEVYYRLNPRYPYLEELKGYLVRKSAIRLRDPIWQDLERLNSASLIILTGLFTGQLHIPTDLVIVGGATPAAIKKVIDKIEKEIRQEINYAVFSLTEFEERENMYDRFARDLFENPHLIVLDKRSKKSREPKTSPLKKRAAAA